MSRHIYTLKKPASWHKELWREALPLGNGLTGVLIPGAVGKEEITFNRHDLWRGAGNGDAQSVHRRGLRDQCGDHGTGYDRLARAGVLRS